MHAVVAIDSNAHSGRFIATYNGLFVYDAKSEKHIDFNMLFPKAKLINEKL